MTGVSAREAASVEAATIDHPGPLTGRVIKPAASLSRNVYALSLAAAREYSAKAGANPYADEIGELPCVPPTDAVIVLPALAEQSASAADASVVPGGGETSVSEEWLNARSAALDAIAADYASALARARDSDTGAGWVVQELPVIGEFGAVIGTQSTPVLVDTGLAAPGWRTVAAVADEHGTVAAPRRQFGEAQFLADYTAEAAGNPVFAALAQLYGQDSPGLTAQHPELIGLALDAYRALNAGPAPSGLAMAPPAELFRMDMLLTDPDMAAMIAQYGGPAAVPAGDVALAQASLYGANRFAQMTQMQYALAAVRTDYVAQLQAARAGAPDGPGWVDQTVARVTGIEGEPSVSAATERVFSIDAFTETYRLQDRAGSRLFDTFYGPSTTTRVGSDDAGNPAFQTYFADSQWQLAGEKMINTRLTLLDVQNVPDLHNRQAVYFEPGAGWVTARQNIDEGTDWTELALDTALVAFVSYVTAGTASDAAALWAYGAAAEAGAGAGASAALVAGAATGAAVTGVASSLASGLLNGNLSLAGVLTGALSGALSAGLMQALGNTPAIANLGRGGRVLSNVLTQGVMSELRGGSLEAGAISGLASGLAGLAAGAMNASVDAGVRAGTVSSAEAAAARVFTRIVASALRAAGSPGDRNQTIARNFIDGLVGEQVFAQMQAQTLAQRSEEGRAAAAAAASTVTTTPTATATAAPSDATAGSAEDAAAYDRRLQRLQQLRDSLDQVRNLQIDPDPDTFTDAQIRAYQIMLANGNDAKEAARVAHVLEQALEDPELAEMFNFGAKGQPETPPPYTQVKPPNLDKLSDAAYDNAYQRMRDMGGNHEQALAQAYEASMLSAVAQEVNAIDARRASGDPTVSTPATAQERMRMVMALISKDAYFDQSVSDMLPASVRRLTDDEVRRLGIVPSDLDDKLSGYFGAVYLDSLTGHIIFANRGTEFGLLERRSLDMQANVLQALGLESAQYTRAMNLARRITAENADEQIVFTGHSLGGGLASAQAVVAGRTATTFNAAGLTSITTERQYGIAGGLSSMRNIDAVFVQGEFVSALQDRNTAWVRAPIVTASLVPALRPMTAVVSAFELGPPAIGQRTAIGPVDLPRWMTIRDLSSPTGVSASLIGGITPTSVLDRQANPIESFQQHGMDRVIFSLRQRLPN